MVPNRPEHARRHHLGLRFDSQLDAPLGAARVADVVSGAVTAVVDRKELVSRVRIGGECSSARTVKEIPGFEIARL